VARFSAVATVVGTSGTCFMSLGPSRSSLPRALPVGALFDAAQQRDFEVNYRRVAGLRSEGQLGDVDGGGRSVVLGVGR
jgi:hypothetical protein